MNANPNSMGAGSFDDVRDMFRMEPAVAADWGTDWPEAQRLYELEGLEFLSVSYTSETCRRMRMAPDTIQAFLDTLPSLGGNDLLRRFAWHCHYRLFRSPARDAEPPRTWPVPPEQLGVAGRMFYAFVCLSGVPYFEMRHRALGVDHSITVDTFSDLEIWMHDYRKEHGAWGFTMPAWMMNHFRARLFRLGRLQFEMSAFPLDFHAFRNADTQEVILFAGDSLRFRQDGQLDGTNGITDERAWHSAFRVDDSVAAGNPISPYGGAERYELRLPLKDWQPILKREDACLNVHIAAEAPLDHDMCLASYRQAVRFFADYFPGCAFGAFYCDSWLLDRQLADYLPRDSNIVRFLSDWRLLPVPRANDTQSIERVFGRSVKNPLVHHPVSSLQKAMIAHMKRGGRWRNAAGIIFPEDLQFEE